MPKKSTSEKKTTKTTKTSKHNCPIGKMCFNLTRQGKASLWFIAGHIIMMLIFNIVAALYHPAVELRTPFELASWPLSGPLALAGLAGIASFVFGLVAIFKARERSALVILATVYGFMILLFAIAELSFDH